jgi:rare lipoprotein A
MNDTRQTRLTHLATLVLACGVGAGAGLGSMVVRAAPHAMTQPPTAPQDLPQQRAHAVGAARRLDRSGRKQVGTASFYAAHYAGKKMADGTPMQLYSNNAASLTLPLGTAARVTNLATGRSAMVIIQDRGPYAKGRIIDLSPATAQKIGITKAQGLAKVEVEPITVPLADGSLWRAPGTLARN